LESLKDADVEREGNRSSFTSSGCLTFSANFMISTLVALTTRLVADVKALSEEKDVRLVADQSLVEEKGAQEIVDQSLRAFEEANAALTQDI
jgi:hypothetical protein